MNRGQEKSNRGGRHEQGSFQRTGGQHQQTSGDQKKDARPKKESIIDLSKFVDKQVRVKFQGGREATGILKGYDQVLNLVLSDCVEYLRDTDESYKVTDNTRKLGLVVCRGAAVTVVCPQAGHEAIQNPFTAIED